MKILHIIASHLHKAGGIPVVLKELSDNQNLLEGTESRVLSIKESKADFETAYFDYLNEHASLETYLIKYNPDIIIFHGVYYREYINASRTIRKMGYKYCIEPHGSFGNAAQKKSMFKKRVANITLFSRFLVGATGYIYLSEEEEQDSVFLREKNAIVPNGCKARDIKNVKLDNVNMYYIGRYDINHKGLDVLFDALEILKQKNELDFEFDFYGSGSENEVKYVKERIDKLNNTKIRMNGPIYDVEKEQILSKKNIMVLTSRYEGMPMTILEALSYGCPCIVTPGTNFAVTIKEKNIGWVSDFDKQSVAEMLLKAQNEYRKNRGQYIEMAVGYIREYHSWDKIAKDSVKQYEKIINK